ncbi:NAD(P)H-dependent oxidoreductase [Fictibacillus sp. 18YEL24]|uniref:NAD(P)H-dependent oxidoreductase n=1 Tax=Fictibacillus sp. 18YEL24 TaxID=2745875 RepID=UPI0018CD8976|nr:NAD(P)H-dependent oxidoreductase [Fictibacillus sp. 18YEL24]MBH0171181.1 NAD(P)H-dependent oxidoreductase [Fictibacillus sp. 18YEL24]
MKSTLVIIAHPNLQNSTVNKRWAEEIEKQDHVTVRKLYDLYPDGKVNVEEEQRMLLQHDRIVLQFPFYWYSSPSLLKEWQDQVLAFGWAYGPGGDALHGKELVLAISTGGPDFSYKAGGYNHYTISELLRPFQATSNLIGTRYISPFVFHSSIRASEEALEQSAQEYIAHVLNPEI